MAVLVVMKLIIILRVSLGHECRDIKKTKTTMMIMVMKMMMGKIIMALDITIIIQTTRTRALTSVELLEHKTIIIHTITTNVMLLIIWLTMTTVILTMTKTMAIMTLETQFS